MGHICDKESSYDLINLLFESCQGPQCVCPKLASGVELISHVDSFEYGAPVVIIPANMIECDFGIHKINIEQMETKDVPYIIELFVSGESIGCSRFITADNKGLGADGFFMTDILPKNSEVTGRLAVSGGGELSIVLSVYYHLFRK